MEINKIIKDYRKRNKLTQNDLALKIGISCRALQNYEKGVRIPLLDTKIKLCEVLGIPKEELGIDNIQGLYILPRPNIKDILPGVGELKEKKDCIISYLGKMQGMLQSGEYNNRDMEYILNDVYELYTKRTSEDILKEFIESLHCDYDIKHIDNDDMNNILKKVSDVIELEFYKLNK